MEASRSSFGSYPGRGTQGNYESVGVTETLQTWVAVKELINVTIIYELYKLYSQTIWFLDHSNFSYVP